MIESATQTLRQLLRFLPQHDPWRALSREAIVIALFLLVIVALERLNRADLTRYRRREFFNDFVYALFYQGGIYNFLIYVPVFSTLQKRLAFADLHVLTSVPAPVSFILFWLIADFVGYWIHRMQHAVPFLWAFHSVHHAPSRITFLTSNRLHVVEQFVANALMFIPILVLGVPQKVWLPFIVFHTMLEALQHATLSWRYGPLYRVFVSPLFHNLHHSTIATEYNGNYSKILSIWDFVFGTAVDRESLPAAYGIEGIEIPERLSAQLVAPFKILRKRSETAAVEAAETVA